MGASRRRSDDALPPPAGREDVGVGMKLPPPVDVLLSREHYKVVVSDAPFVRVQSRANEYAPYVREHEAIVERLPAILLAPDHNSDRCSGGQLSRELVPALAKDVRGDALRFNIGKRLIVPSPLHRGMKLDGDALASATSLVRNLQYATKGVQPAVSLRCPEVRVDHLDLPRKAQHWRKCSGDGIGRASYGAALHVPSGSYFVDIFRQQDVSVLAGVTRRKQSMKWPLSMLHLGLGQPRLVFRDRSAATASLGIELNKQNLKPLAGVLPVRRVSDKHFVEVTQDPPRPRRVGKHRE